MSDELEAWWEQASPRERDALVAEHVMGWHWNGYEWEVPGKRNREWQCHCDPYEACHCNLFRPSTDIAAAWEVVEKDRTIILTRCDDGWLAFSTPHGEIRYPEVYNDGQDGFMDVPIHTDAWATANTAPEAICLAALKAVGYDPEES